MKETNLLIGIGFLGSLGVFFLILGCTLSSNWWMLLLVVFYIFTPIPLLFVTNDGYSSMGDSSGNKGSDVAIFIATGIMVSTIAFPIIMTRSPGPGVAPYIDAQNCVFAEIATFFVYITTFLFLTVGSEPDF